MWQASRLRSSRIRHLLNDEQQTTNYSPMTNTEFKTGVISPIDCVKEGFELIKNDYWLLFAIGLVGGLISGATLYILGGAMLCGIMFAFLKVVDRKPITFDDLWKGMEFFGPG